MIQMTDSTLMIMVSYWWTIDFFFKFTWVKNLFSINITPRSFILGKAFGSYGYFCEAVSFSKIVTLQLERFLEHRTINPLPAFHGLPLKRKTMDLIEIYAWTIMLLFSMQQKYHMWHETSDSFWHSTDLDGPKRSIFPKLYCLFKIALWSKRLTQN